MTNVTTLITLIAIALLLMAGGTSCGSAAGLATQLAQSGVGNDDGTPDQGPGDFGVGGSVGGNSTDDDGTPDQGSGDFGVPGSGGNSTDDDGTADQGRGDRGDDRDRDDDNSGRG